MSNEEQITDEDRFLLSEEEISAMEDDTQEMSDDEDQEEGVVEDNTGNKVDDESENEKSDQPEDNATEEADLEQKVEQNEELEAEKPEVATNEQLNPSPQDRIEQIKNELDELGEKVEEGEIDLVEYNKLNNQLVEEREDIKSYLRDEQRNQQASQNDINQRWEQASNEFLAVPGNDIVANNQMVQDAFMSACRSINQGSEAQQNGFLWVMNQAKSQMIDAGFTFKGVESEKKQAKRHTDVDVPTTLGDVPANTPNDSGGEFDYLDKLEGLEYEEEIAKLTPEQEARYAIIS